MMTAELIRSRRKTLALQVRPDGSVLVRAPLYSSKREIERFLERDIQKNPLPEGLGEAPEYQKSSPHKNSRGRGGRHRGGKPQRKNKHRNSKEKRNN